MTGRMCLRITFAERPNRPARFCNRYVSSSIVDPFAGPLGNPIGFSAAMDASAAFSLIELFTGPTPHVSNVHAEVGVRRGERVAFLRRVRAPRRVRPGQRVTLRVTMQRLRGGNFTRRYRVNLPGGLKPGRRTLRLTGAEQASEDEDLLAILFGLEEEENGGNGEPSGPSRLNDLIESISALGHWDGVELRMGGTTKRAFRDDDMLVVGRASTSVRVRRR